MNWFSLHFEPPRIMLITKRGNVAVFLLLLFFCCCFFILFVLLGLVPINNKATSRKSGCGSVRTRNGYQIALALQVSMTEWCDYLRNEFYFWSVHGIMNTSGLLQS